jgi:hypothetical protein
MAKQIITASMLYDYLECPHRVVLDVYGDQGERDDIHPFVELLQRPIKNVRLSLS